MMLCGFICTYIDTMSSDECEMNKIKICKKKNLHIWKAKTFLTFYYTDFNLLYTRLCLHIFSRLSVQLPPPPPRAGVTFAIQPDADNKYGVGQWPLHGFIRKGPGYWPFAERGSNSHVSAFSMLLELRKYCGFSMTGIFVIPMITASGPISEDDGVLLPLETWWRGLAESSSLLMTEEEPGEPQRRRETKHCGHTGRRGGGGEKRKYKLFTMTIMYQQITGRLNQHENKAGLIHSSTVIVSRIQWKLQWALRQKHLILTYFPLRSIIQSLH